MKPRIVVLLSGTLTLALGYWLAEHSRDSREIWTALGCWALGFWFASSILSYSSPMETRDADDYDDEDEEDPAIS